MKFYAPFLLLGFAFSAAEAHDPKLHKKSKEAPNCAYLQSMDKANSDALVVKALEQKCYSELHAGEHNKKQPESRHKHDDGHQHAGHQDGKHHHSDLSE